jgi:two-component system, chemotaxis family, sensor kinase CheA
MIIEDEELRNLYKISGEERLQKLEAGLVRLEQRPNDAAALEALRREIHSLKGDSRSVGLETIARLTEQIEGVIKSIQRQELILTAALSNTLFQGLDAIGQLMYEAVSGETTGIDPDAIMAQLMAAVASPELQPAFPSSPISSPDPATSPVIDDDELREIYKTTSEERLQRLETNLARLEEAPTDPVILESLRREIHSLKGDSRSVGLDTIAIVTNQLEDIVKSLKQQELQHSTAISDALFQGSIAIRQLIHEAVTGEPSGIDAAEILAQLMAVVEESPPVAQPSQPGAEAIPQPVESVSLSAFTAIAPTIDDEELRQIYQATSEERLQKLEAGLVQLEQNPTDAAIFAELLREAHSLKGDSRSAGVDSVETITHQFEDLLERLQRREMILTPTVSDRLYTGLDAISQLVQEAITGEPSHINISQVLKQLREIVPAAIAPVTVAVPSPTITEPPEVVSLPPEPIAPGARADEPYQIDTIRVQTRDLDSLMTQAEELTVTKIQISQAIAKVEQVALLWEEWKTNRTREEPTSTTLTVNPYEERLEQLVKDLRATTQENSTRLDLVAEALSEKIRALRLLPLSTVFQLFPRMVRDLARQQSKLVELIIEGGDTTADKQILEGVKDALMHLVRNAIDHGIETPEERRNQGKPTVAKIWLRGYSIGNSIIIDVADDGRGLNLEQVKQTALRRKLFTPEELDAMSPSQIQALILTPGFSTRTMITEISGRGVGLDVVQTNIERLKGSLQIESTPGQGCTFRLQLNTKLATANVVLIEVQGILHALPFEYLQATVLVSPEEIITTDDGDTLIVNETEVPVANLVEVLELSNSLAYPSATRARPRTTDRQICVLIKVGEEQAGFFVDRLLDTQEVVLKPQSRMLKRVRNVLGATTLATGEVCMILNPSDLIKSLQKPAITIASTKPKETAKRKPTILLVEDSPPVRTQEKRLFEGAGYEVTVAVDGLDGYNKLRSRNFDAVVSDIEMPNLDGLSLTAKIRQHPEYDELPIILVTTLSSDDDRRRGAEAGANAYITKGKFNQEVLLETLARLV